MARRLGDDIGDRARADHVACGELGGVVDRAFRDGERVLPRLLAIFEVGAWHRDRERRPPQIEVTAATGRCNRDHAGHREDRIGVLGGEVAALVVQRIGVAEKGQRIAQACGGECGREQRALCTLLGDEQRRDRDCHEWSSERLREPKCGGAPAAAARTA